LNFKWNVNESQNVTNKYDKSSIDYNAKNKKITTSVNFYKPNIDDILEIKKYNIQDER